ncbi:MAG TPA: hypothetical protein VK604_03090 [Bryobacteraceae bacterium]|nr:hypothetical protein [Bryobacteraceae bacterium]
MQGEPSIPFSPASDVFTFNTAVFGITNGLHFANGQIGNLPTSGANVIVLQTTDDDANPATPFAAGNAASLIAAHGASDAPGLFVYFNSALDLPRLVFSTDLGSNTADLAVLARFTNLTGQAGIDALPTFSAANFAASPEPSSVLLISVSGAFIAFGCGRRRNRARNKDAEKGLPDHRLV